MKEIYHIAIFVSIASGVIGVISFLLTHKSRNRRIFLGLLAAIFVVSLVFTIAVRRQEGKNNLVLPATHASPYIANGSNTRRIYFHNHPNPSARRNAYINTQVEVVVQKIENEYGYISFTNTEGASSFGWVEMKYLVRKP